jgi:high-affinity Fe2+/Pb2+ permease
MHRNFIVILGCIVSFVLIALISYVLFGNNNDEARPFVEYGCGLIVIVIAALFWKRV